MDITLDKLAEECVNAINNKIKGLNTLNIIIAGKTGVGKSTLINNVFGKTLAETGIGQPVTPGIRKITHPGFPLAIYDTKGFELGKEAQEKTKNEIIEQIQKGEASKDINQKIHCIWYCVNALSGRLEPEEELWIRDITSRKDNKIPVIIILTQAYFKQSAEALKKNIIDRNLDVMNIIPVVAADMTDNDPIIKAYGLDKLVKIMGSVLPDELLDTFQHVQIACLEEKKKYAQAAIATTVALAFGEGFTPVPFSDAAMLIPTQVSMIASITAIFGLEINKSILVGFVSAALGTTAATIGGKTLVSGLLKLIPGVGTIVGGLISGTTAALLTTALGESYILLMEQLSKGEIKANELNTEEGREKLSTLFKQQLQRKK